jgi:hypothetical protein
MTIYGADTPSVRDSKDQQAAVLVFSAAEWAGFIAGVQDGGFGE